MIIGKSYGDHLVIMQISYASYEEGCLFPLNKYILLRSPFAKKTPLQLPSNMLSVVMGLHN